MISVQAVAARPSEVLQRVLREGQGEDVPAVPVSEARRPGVRGILTGQAFLTVLVEENLVDVVIVSGLDRRQLGVQDVHTRTPGLQPSVQPFDPIRRLGGGEGVLQRLEGALPVLFHGAGGVGCLQKRPAPRHVALLERPDDLVTGTGGIRGLRKPVVGDP